jgi:hypothetical protein
MRRAFLAFALLTAVGCAPRITVPEDQRREVSREFEGQRLLLKVAVNAGPFFADRSKMLISEQPFGELDLLEDTAGEPIQPPAAERVLPPGTWMRVDKVEFPTGWTIARRVLLSPRYHPWVYLTLADDERPYILVLPQTVASAEDVRAEIDRVLSSDDPGTTFRALPDEQRAAVERKVLAEGMGPRGVEMAWGYPDKKKIDKPAGTEEWSWPGGKRRAFFQDGRLTRWEPK